MICFYIIFWLSALLIFHTMIFYPISLKFLNIFVPKKDLKRELDYRPTVSIIIPAHNEESVIYNKLENLINLNFPKDLSEIIISSDNSTDRTNEIVEEFINNHPDERIILYNVEERKGKTNAQNEAARISKGEILIFSDANAILDKDAVIHLVSSFTEDNIVYVSGKLVYINNLTSLSSEAVSTYWNYDLFMRKVESDIKTITAGNGAIYAIRKSEYIDFDPILCHDAVMPTYAAINNKRALFNENAVAYEKAGETVGDEFKRKVRMSRKGLDLLFSDFKKYNPFKYGWYSYFYFGHRACRMSLFIFHIFLFISNAFLLNVKIFYKVIFLLQCTFYLTAVLSKYFGWKSRIFHYPYFYSMTLAAQLIGSYNYYTGKSKPFWEKAESTR